MLTSWIRRRLVQAGGRTWLVGPPTLGAVLLFLEAFAVEVYALARATGEGKTRPPGEDPVETMLPAFLDRRLVEPLAEVVEAPGLSRAEVRALLEEANQEVLAELARASVGLCDLPRCLAFLGLDQVAERDAAEIEESEGDPSPSDQELAVLALAARFGVPPREVLSWPLEEFMVAVEGVPLLAGEGAGGGGGERALRADADSLAALALAGADVSPPPEA